MKYGVNCFLCENKPQTNAAISDIRAALDQVKIGSGFFCGGAWEREIERQKGGAVWMCITIHFVHIASHWHGLFNTECKMCSFLYVKGEVTVDVDLMLSLRVIELLNYSPGWSILNQCCCWLMTCAWYAHTRITFLTGPHFHPGLCNVTVKKIFSLKLP